MTRRIGHGTTIAVLTPDPVLYQSTEKALRGFLISNTFADARVIIADIGARKMALPPGLPPGVPVIALVPRRTFDLARALFNAGASDVLVRNVPPGTLGDAVEALLAAAPRPAGSSRTLTEEVQLLRDLSEWARGNQDLPVFFQRIVDSVADTLDVDIVSLMLTETDPEIQRDILRIRAAKGLSDQIIRLSRVEIGNGISGLVAAKGEPLLVQDVEQTDLGVPVSRTRYSTKSLLSVPIKTMQQTIGVLNVNNKINGAAFDDNDMNLLVTLCNQVGLAIDNARLVTDLRRHADDLQALNRRIEAFSQAKSELICNLSHELKTPLTAIQGYVDLIRSGVADAEKTPQFLDKIRDRSAHMARLAERLVTFFALDAGHVDFEFKPFPLGVLIWTSAEAVRLYAEANNIKIELDIDPIDKHVYGDQTQYRELLLALLDNAVKFNRRGGMVRVYGELLRRDGRDLIEVFVEDSGHGIPASLHDHIFDEFKQTTDIMTAKPDGLGLGLAIARAIVMAHDCTLRLVKSGDTGSIFAFTIPVAEK